MHMRRFITITAIIVLLFGSAATARDHASADVNEQLWITNVHGDDIHIYEVGTWRLIDHIVVGPEPHGISATADGRIVHVSIEHPDRDHGELVWVDAITRRVIDRIDVGPRPHEIECTPDGKWIYVPCHDGTWWIVDGFERRVVKRIGTGGRPHNTIISPDHSRMYLAPMGLKVRINDKKKYLGPESVTVVDIDAGHEVIGEIKFSDHPRPITISADGRWIYQNVDDLTGFEIADTSTFKVVEEVEHEIHPEYDDRDSRCHGLAITPDGSEIWCCDLDRHRVHVHELTSGSHKQIATIPVVGRTYWIVFSTDGVYAFVSLRSENRVAVIDTKTRQVVTHLAAGDTPKRTQVIRVPKAP